MNLKFEYKHIQNWRMNISGREPEIFCIFGGSCINQLILRDTSESICSSVYSFHDAHHDEHWHHESSSRIENENVLNLVTGLQEGHTFMLPKGLKFRKEKNGLVIGRGRSAYFINDKGSQFLELLGNRVTVSDIRRICEQLSVPEQAGLDFFKKLIIFGVLKWIQ